MEEVAEGGYSKACCELKRASYRQAQSKAPCSEIAKAAEEPVRSLPGTPPYLAHLYILASTVTKRAKLRRCEGESPNQRALHGETPSHNPTLSAQSCALPQPWPSTPHTCGHPSRPWPHSAHGGRGPGRRSRVALLPSVGVS